MHPLSAIQTPLSNSAPLALFSSAWILASGSALRVPIPSCSPSPSLYLSLRHVLLVPKCTDIHPPPTYPQRHHSFCPKVTLPEGCRRPALLEAATACDFNCYFLMNLLVFVYFSLCACVNVYSEGTQRLSTF